MMADSRKRKQSNNRLGSQPDINPIYNISADPKKQNWPLIKLQLLIDSGQNLNQPGFQLQMPGFRLSKQNRKQLAEITVEAYQESKKSSQDTTN